MQHRPLRPLINTSTSGRDVNRLAAPLHGKVQISIKIGLLKINWENVHYNPVLGVKRSSIVPLAIRY